MLYYKIPPHYIKEFGLENILVAFPDGNYLCPQAVLARIDPDPEIALAKSGGIALSPDEARDEQMGISYHPLPNDATDYAEPEDEDNNLTPNNAEETPS